MDVSSTVTALFKWSFFCRRLCVQGTWSDDAEGSCGRSPDQTSARKSSLCDIFPSWRREARVCKHILTARQRLGNLLLGQRHSDDTRTPGLVSWAQTVAAAPTNCLRHQTFRNIRPSAHRCDAPSLVAATDGSGSRRSWRIKLWATGKKCRASVGGSGWMQTRQAARRRYML